MGSLFSTKKTPACELRNTKRQLLAIRRDLHAGDGCVVAPALCCMCWLSTTCGKSALLADGTHIAPPDGVFAWRSNRADRVWFRPCWNSRVRNISKKQVWASRRRADQKQIELLAVCLSSRDGERITRGARQGWCHDRAKSHTPRVGPSRSRYKAHRGSPAQGWVARAVRMFLPNRRGGCPQRCSRYGWTPL